MDFRTKAAIAGVAGATGLVAIGCLALYRIQSQIHRTHEFLSGRIAELQAESQKRIEGTETFMARNLALNRVHELEPRRAQLAILPTPLLHLQLPGLDHVQLAVKLDSESGFELSGNKVRKLEYLLDAALASGATAVITCGGPQSNHARATVVAARRLGLVPHVVLRRPADMASALTTGNLFLMGVFGAKITWIEPAEYANRDAIMKGLATELHRNGVRSYVIPEGGSNALGCWGYIRMLSELLDDYGEVPYDVLALAVGSEGTLAGVLVGRSLLGLSSQFGVVGFSVGGKPLADVRAGVERIAAEFKKQFNLPELELGDYELLDVTGPGYSITTPETIKTIRDVAEYSGVMLDGTYAGKAMAGLLAELRRPTRAAPFHNSSFCFVHTGGGFGLFSQAGDFQK